MCERGCQRGDGSKLAVKDASSALGLAVGLQMSDEELAVPSADWVVDIAARLAVDSSGPAIKGVTTPVSPV